MVLDVQAPKVEKNRSLPRGIRKSPDFSHPFVHLSSAPEGPVPLGKRRCNAAVPFLD